MLSAKDKSVSALTKGVEGLLKKNKVDYIKGAASFASPTEIDVALLDGGKTQISGKNIIIATGSEVTPFPGIEVDEKQVVSSTGALDLQQVPKKMVVIGGGVIGLELGSVWNHLGSEVTVVEFLNTIGGAGIDQEIATSFHKILQKQGIKFRMGHKVIDMEKKDGKCYLNVESAKDGKKDQIEADVVLVAIGRRPVTSGLNLEKIGVEKDEKGRIVVDSQFNTSVKGVKCIGDATFGPMLAHKAEEEGKILLKKLQRNKLKYILHCLRTSGFAAIEMLKNGHGHVNYDAIPAVVYTHPEVAWVGKNEDELKKAGVAYKIGKVSLFL